MRALVAVITHRGSCQVLLASLLLGTALAVPAAAQSRYRFIKIADTSTQFSGGMLFPSVDASGKVTFPATLRAGGQGIFRSSGGALETVFFTNSNDFDTPVVSGNGTVLFDLRAPGGGPGIALLVWKDGTLTTIADDTGPLDNLSGLPSVNDNGMVVFWAGLDAGGNGIFTRSLAGGPIVPLVDDSGGFASFGQGVVVNGHGQVAFNADLDHGESGIFVTDGTAVVEFATSSGALNGFSSPPVINDAGIVVFHACLDVGGCGVFLTNGTGETQAVILQDQYQVQQVQRPTINNQGLIALQATLWDQTLNRWVSGIFTGADPVADKVIAVGDTIGGKVVTALEFFRGLNDAGQVAFWAVFADSSQAIFRADPQPRPTTTTLASSAASTIYGEPITLTATVTSASGTPSGYVQFADGATVLGTAMLNGQGSATLLTSALTAAGSPHQLSATYLGAGTYASSSSASVTQVVSAASTVVTLTSTPNPSTFGQAVILTASVASSAGTPTWTVEFRDGTTLLGTGTLTAGTASVTTSTLAGGSHTLTVSYLGDGNFAASVSPAVTHVVNRVATTTTLSVSPNPSRVGQALILTATVTATSSTPVPPSGTVTFFAGTTALGSATVTGGIATFTTTSLSAGKYTLTAAYAGDTNFTGSTSGPVVQQVKGSGKK